MHRSVLVLLLGVLAPGFLAHAPSRAPSHRPSFLFILVDDLGEHDLGCYGSSFYQTPYLDRLAAGGMRFANAYAAGSVCSPTRAAIMTGKHPARLGITDWIPGQRPRGRKLVGPPILQHLPLSEVTMAEALKDAGYATFFAGKWHLGGEGFLPEDQGFDINKGGHEKGSPPGGYYVPYQNPKLADGPPGEYLTDRLTDETIAFIERSTRSSPERPFLAYLAFYTVHTPIQACKRFIEPFRKKAAGLPPLQGPAQIPEGEGFTKMRQDNPAYASMVRAMDENVGRLLDTLRELGRDRDTIVIFTSDNGGLSTLPRRGYPTSNAPLRAGKGWCYEGGIRVPLIVRWPGVTRPGSSSDAIVVSMDFYPTMLEMAGLAPRPAQHADGLSLVPLLRETGSLDRDTLAWHYPHYHGSAWKPGAAIRQGSWKLIEFYEDEKVELFDLAADPGEQHDLSGEKPKRTRALLDHLHQWQRDIGARMPRPNPGR